MGYNTAGAEWCTRQLRLPTGLCPHPCPLASATAYNSAVVGQVGRGRREEDGNVPDVLDFLKVTLIRSPKHGSLTYLRCTVYSTVSAVVLGSPKNY